MTKLIMMLMQPIVTRRLTSFGVLANNTTACKNQGYSDTFPRPLIRSYFSILASAIAATRFSLGSSSAITRRIVPAADFAWGPSSPKSRRA